MRISDWSSDVCSSDLAGRGQGRSVAVPPKKEGARIPLSPEAFQERAAVSRETLDRFHLYAALLTKWNRAINLVSAASMADLWRRHSIGISSCRERLCQSV